MDKRFLNKVLGQIVSETTIKQRRGGKVYITLINSRLYFISSSIFPSLPTIFFVNHCKEVYGLNDDEIKYVWDEYKTIIKDKINNG